MYAKQYAQNGFCVVPGLLTAAECHRLKAEAVSVMRQHAPPHATVYVGASVVSPLFRQLADDPRIVTVLRELMPAGIAFLAIKSCSSPATNGLHRRGTSTLFTGVGRDRNYRSGLRSMTLALRMVRWWWCRAVTGKIGLPRG